MLKFSLLIDLARIVNVNLMHVNQLTADIYGSLVEKSLTNRNYCRDVFSKGSEKVNISH